MDLDIAFASSLLLEGDKSLNHCLDRGIDPESHLFGAGKEAFKYIYNHYKVYGSLPSSDVVFEKTGAYLYTNLKEPLDFYIDEVRNRRLWHICKDGIDKAAPALDKNTPTEAAEVFTEIHKKVQNEELTEKKVESLLSLGKEVIKKYDDAKLGKRGIPTPWPSMDDQTMGWQPEDLALFVGRQATGKTWLLIICCHSAWKNGNKVLVVSTEMNRVNMAMRFFSVHLGMTYSAVRKGKLGEFVENKFKDGVLDLLSDDGIDIVSGGFDFTIDNVNSVISDNKPDIVSIDGAYLIKNHGKDRHEKVSNNFDDFKRMGAMHKHATLTTSQFNRSARTGQSDTIAAENIGITDVAGWNADIAYGLSQDQEQHEQMRMTLKSLKIREGKPEDILINWNLDSMNFEEIDSGKDSSDGEDGGYDDIPF